VRITITLDPDTEELIKRAMRERDLSFKEAVNQAIRAGLAPRSCDAPAGFPTYPLGQPLVDATRRCAWQRSSRIRWSRESSPKASNRVPNANSYLLPHAAEWDASEHDFAWPVRALVAANSVAPAPRALEHDAEIVSFDRDFGRFEGVRWRLPE
jgi:hypothetical protein